MEHRELNELTGEDLKTKLKSLRSLSWICQLSAVFLLGMLFHDSLNGKEIQTSLLVIALCSIGGGVYLSPQIKEIRAELEKRG